MRISPDATPTVSAVDVDTGETVSLSSIQTETATGSNGTYDWYWVTLDPTEVTYARTVKITWSYDVSGNTFTHADFIDVVQPLVTPDEVRQAYPQFDTGGADEKTYDEIKAMERTVRKIIEAYTNQTFAPKGEQTMRLFGSGSNFLHLPERIYSLEYVAAEDPEVVLYDQTVSGGKLLKRDDDGNEVVPNELHEDDLTGPVEIVTWDEENRWVIRRRLTKIEPWDIKEDISPEILNPRNIFQSKRSYLIRASIGWEIVPNEVNQAAKLLIDDYFCNDAKFHERGLSRVKSADWTMEFAADPYTTTGNIYADQLLSRYVNQNWVVL